MSSLVLNAHLKAHIVCKKEGGELLELQPLNDTVDIFVIWDKKYSKNSKSSTKNFFDLYIYRYKDIDIHRHRNIHAPKLSVCDSWLPGFILFDLDEGHCVCVCVEIPGPQCWHTSHPGAPFTAGEREKEKETTWTTVLSHLCHIPLPWLPLSACFRGNLHRAGSVFHI